jgi:hypothetical protein
VFFHCFIYQLKLVTGEGDCNIAMCENTNVKCQIKAFDSNFENIIVENLITPMPVPINKAILRTSDIISMQFNWILSPVTLAMLALSH